MAEKLTDVYRRAENSLLESRYEDALRDLSAVVQAAPDHIWARFKIGSVLQKLKMPNRAFDVFAAAAWHCIKAGYPLLGLVATKRAINLQATFEGALNALADLYSLESERINAGLPLSSLPTLDPDQSIEVAAIPVDKVGATATALAKEYGAATYPTDLPPIPLFSLLAAEAFYPILEIMALRTYAPGETIVKTGDPCTSIYMLAHGEVEVTEGREGEEHTLARLTSGSVFGEMALITDAPRVATATAVRESEILELKREDLEVVAEDLDDITWALAKFTRQRFINNLLLTSPIFTPFPEEDRPTILDRFTSIGVPTDEVIIREGEPGPGLYIILGGEVEVSKFEEDTRVHLARLIEGSVFGEISLVNDTATTATVQATRGGEFLFLAREDFQDLIAESPEIKEALATLSEERLEEQRTAMDKLGITSKDGSVIF